jgi:hypothetical protein
MAEVERAAISEDSVVHAIVLPPARDLTNDPVEFCSPPEADQPRAVRQRAIDFHGDALTDRGTLDQ